MGDAGSLRYMDYNFARPDGPLGHKTTPAMAAGLPSPLDSLGTRLVWSALETSGTDLAAGNGAPREAALDEAGTSQRSWA